MEDCDVVVEGGWYWFDVEFGKYVKVGVVKGVLKGMEGVFNDSNIVNL